MTGSAVVIVKVPAALARVTTESSYRASTRDLVAEMDAALPPAETAVPILQELAST